MLTILHEARKDKKKNSNLMNMLSYFSSLREWGTVRHLLRNVGRLTNDRHLVSSLSKLFLLDSRAKEYFGIAEDIVGSMSNMVFGGNIGLKVEDEEVQNKLNEIYNDGYFMQSIINAYKAAIATNGRSFIFMETTINYDPKTELKTGDKFIKYTVVPEFELEINNLENRIVRSIFKDILTDEKNTYEVYRFDYIYEVFDGNTKLSVEGYDEEDYPLTKSEIKEFLGIDILETYYNFVPFGIVDVGEGMLPNIIFIEDSLSENLYFQDEDLANAQTSEYIPESQIEEIHRGSATYNVFDKYQSRRTVKGGIDKETITSVEGKSAIMPIERNLALNVIQASLDAKINPISIGYVLTDRMGSNTDVGADKERASIRLRESHIDKLKPFIAKELNKRLKLEGIEIDLEEIGIIFAQYITPSIESLTNTLAKQIQFGIISIETAVRKINRDVLSEEEVQKEVERIQRTSTQIDLNMKQNLSKGIDNRLNGDGIEE